MDPERWQAVEALFGAALERPAPERLAYIEAACAGDAALRSEVASLLIAAESDPGFLEDPIALVTGLEPADADDDEPMPPRVGPWRIVEAAGRGGMAQVYLAARDDGTFEQRVALKVIRRGLDTEDLLARFRAERRILGSLHHPNIATVLDAGALPDGRPYFVMEYVAGEPITDWCAARALPVEERLHRFAEVCDAVRHAHARLIVHRDIKPGNILVGADGHPKLLDFGIAKLLDPSDADGSAPETRAGLRAMTPQYASPEQVAGAPVTTASDVYSLGVLLYELLAGQLPYVVKGRSRHEVEQLVRDTVPPRPSDVARVPSLSRRLRGDLDTIVLKALQKDPERRYGSAQALGEDVRRHLAGRPILARPDTLGYRTRKFITRHPWGVGLALLAAVALAGFTAFTAVQSARIRAHAAEVARQRARGERVIGFLQELFRSSDPFSVAGDSLTARVLLDRGTARIASELAGEPAARADLLIVMANAYRGLAAYDRADTLAQEALRLRRSLPGEGAGVAEALVLLGNIESDRGDQAAALPRYEEALAIQRRVLGPAHAAVGSTLSSIGLTRFEAGDLPGAQGILRQALVIERNAGPGADSGLAITTNNLALVLKNQGVYAEAESLYRESLALRRRLYGDESPFTVTATMNLARLLRDQGQYPEAARLLGLATEGDRRTLGDRHPYVLGDQSNLAGVLYDLGRYGESVQLLQATLPVQREVLGSGHPDIASSLMRLGRALAAEERLAQAESAHLEARAILAARFDRRHPLLLGNESDLAALYRLQGRLAVAETLQASVARDFAKALGATHPMTAAAVARLGRVLADRGRLPEAEQAFRQALTAAEKSLPAGHPFTAEIESQLGDVMAAEGRTAEAELMLREGAATLRERLGADHPRTIEADQKLARRGLAPTH